MSRGTTLVIQIFEFIRRTTLVTLVSPSPRAVLPSTFSCRLLGPLLLSGPDISPPSCSKACAHVTGSLLLMAPCCLLVSTSVTCVPVFTFRTDGGITSTHFYGNAVPRVHFVLRLACFESPASYTGIFRLGATIGSSLSAKENHP